MADIPRPKIIVTKFTEEAAQNFVKHMDNLELEFSSSQPILIQIDSYGGSVDGLALMYDKIKSMSNPIITYCASKAMSAGAILLSVAGSPGMRYASPEANIMVHEIQTGAFGDIKDVEDQVSLSKVLNERWMTILAKSMGLKSAADIRTLIKKHAIGHDVFLTAEQARSLGLIDHVASITMRMSQEWLFVADVPPPTPKTRKAKTKGGR